MARKIGGNLPSQRLLPVHRDVGISRAARDGNTVYYGHLLDDQLNADGVAFLLHLAANHTTNLSCSGNKLLAAKDIWT